MINVMTSGWGMKSLKYRSKGKTEVRRETRTSGTKNVRTMRSRIWHLRGQEGDRDDMQTLGGQGDLLKENRRRCGLQRESSS